MYTPDTIPHLDEISFFLQNALPYEDKDSVTAMALRARQLVLFNLVLPGFKNNEYLVQSHSGSTHTVVSRQGSIKCDSTCRKYQHSGFCAHALSIAIKEMRVDEYCQSLSRMAIHLNITTATSRNIDKQTVGKKKTR